LIAGLFRLSEQGGYRLGCQASCGVEPFALSRFLLAIGRLLATTLWPTHAMLTANASQVARTASTELFVENNSHRAEIGRKHRPSPNGE
jgi:hypothetical protein